jgi:Zn-finger nucleic acid-binding protein
VEIDYCPQCRGVWLDRGELDKLIERSAGLSARYDDDRPAADPGARLRTPPGASRSEYREHREYRDDDDDYRRRKKKSFLGELFDFD